MRVGVTEIVARASRVRSDESVRNRLDARQVLGTLPSLDEAVATPTVVVAATTSSPWRVSAQVSQHAPEHLADAPRR